MSRNHWFITRPKRRLTLAADTLRVFMAVAQGEKWRGNRQLHLMFEDALEQNGIKAVGERRDRQGGGGRTYASWLYALGLYFFDKEGKVWTTLAGEGLLKNEPPAPIFTNQLMKFQYPSPYSVAIRLNPRFRVFPYRFILRLLLHKDLGGYLTEKEVGLFASTLGETDKDLDKVVEAIEIYRNLGSSDDNISAILGDGWERKYTSIGKLQELIDIGNTMFNNLDITGLFEKVSQPVPAFKIHDNSILIVKEILKNKVQLFKRYDEQEVFQRHYGLGLNNVKDIRNFSEERVVTHHDAEAKKVVWSYFSLLSNSPLLKLEQSTYENISNMTAVPVKRVKEIVSSLGVTPSFDIFEQRYLELSVSGLEGARAFEQATAGIFGEYGLGFETEWIGNKPNSPDVLVTTYDKVYGGVLDAKAYKEYSLSGDHQRRMSVVYVPRCSKELNDKNIPLKFFGYVAGDYIGNIEEGLNRIFKHCNVNGFAITAKELISLVRRHREKPFTKTELLDLFSGNQRINLGIYYNEEFNRVSSIENISLS